MTNPTSDRTLPPYLASTSSRNASDGAFPKAAGLTRTASLTTARTNIYASQGWRSARRRWSPMFSGAGTAWRWRAVAQAPCTATRQLASCKILAKKLSLRQRSRAAKRLINLSPGPSHCTKKSGGSRFLSSAAALPVPVPVPQSSVVRGLPSRVPQSSESSRRHHGSAARRADAECHP